MEVSDPQKIMTKTLPKSAVLMVQLRCQDVIIGCVIMQILKHSSHYMYIRNCRQLNVDWRNEGR